MADGLLSNVLGAIDRKKQEVKAGLGLLANNPQEWAAQATARYFPTKEEERQFRMVKEMGGDITQTPYYQKVFDLTQFQGSIKAAKSVSGIKPTSKAENAKERFLESSAVKERLYHATPFDFTEFKPGGNNPERSGAAIWMTPNKEFQPAAHNIRQIPDKPGYMYGSSSNMFTPGTNVMPLYANIKNPLVVTDQTWQKLFEGTGGDPWVMPQRTVDVLKERGHDGVFYLDKNGAVQEVIAFDPTQVKSAIGNRGTYDVTNPSILAAGLPVGLIGSTQVELPKKQEKKPKK